MGKFAIDCRTDFKIMLERAWGKEKEGLFRKRSIVLLVVSCFNTAW